MDFEPVCLDTWARKEHFAHYFSDVPCTYSLTTKLDIAPIMEEKLYPAMLYLIAGRSTRYPEFRMDLDRDGKLGTYSVVHPCYTVFHQDDETFSSIWTEYTEDYGAFCRAYRQDLERFGNNRGMMAKPDAPGQHVPGLYAALGELRRLSAGICKRDTPIFCRFLPWADTPGQRALLAAAVHPGPSCGLRRLSRLPASCRPQGDDRRSRAHLFRRPREVSALCQAQKIYKKSLPRLGQALFHRRRLR